MFDLELNVEMFLFVSRSNKFSDPLLEAIAKVLESEWLLNFKQVICCDV